ncbi:hypothetical protein DI458_01090 [Burkholderia contaminans]|nr:hypothetical protein [Burkholderia contaminans]MBA9841748.1 hypothetical protein [Burkholderia contaminans]MBA9866762.1 hypothetical protein [Burkholderia contaminans]MBA9909524.1 hypothetical protein [Burkholderia contaminans]MBA9933138.1 hypothetical protein [Burkholderia contaminans]
MCHRHARGVVPCMRLAASGSYGRADIRSRANVRPRTFAPTPAASGAAARIRVHPSVESVLFHPIRHPHTRP